MEGCVGQSERPWLQGCYSWAGDKRSNYSLSAVATALPPHRSPAYKKPKTHTLTHSPAGPHRHKQNPIPS